jgi:hypothetical protein
VEDVEMGDPRDDLGVIGVLSMVFLGVISSRPLTRVEDVETGEPRDDLGVIGVGGAAIRDTVKRVKSKGNMNSGEYGND